MASPNCPQARPCSPGGRQRPCGNIFVGQLEGDSNGGSRAPLGLLLVLPRLLQQLLRRLSLHPGEVRGSPGLVGSVLGVLQRRGRDVCGHRALRVPQAGMREQGHHQLLWGRRGRLGPGSSWTSAAVKKSQSVSVSLPCQALRRVPRAAATTALPCGLTQTTPAPAPRFPWSLWLPPHHCLPSSSSTELCAINTLIHRNVFLTHKGSI